MGRCRILQADYVHFTVSGAGAQSFLTRCAAKRIKLWRLHCTENGYAAVALGRDWPKLQEMEGRGGWQIKLEKRRGPGTILENFLHRPGLLVGGAVFAVLMTLLPGFVWKVDFGDTTQEQQTALRGALLQNAVCEGAYLTQSTLQNAERALLMQSDIYGWISLHFTGGCLFIESAPAQQQSIHEKQQQVALYAKDNALVISTYITGGFAAAQAGQYVAKGDLLVDNGKFDRSGNLVEQPAEGIITARIEKEYSAACAQKSVQEILTGTGREERTLYLLGRKYAPEQGQGSAAAQGGPYTEDWQPLQLGIFCLPGAVCTQTNWERKQTKIHYTKEQAQAIAARSCCGQLKAEYPDAIIETAVREMIWEGDMVTCRCRYSFQANIALEGPPPTHIFQKD